MNVFATDQEIINQNTMLSSAINADRLFIVRHQTLHTQRLKAIADGRRFLAAVLLSKMMENQQWYIGGYYHARC